jgi:hypothetical protein
MCLRKSPGEFLTAQLGIVLAQHFHLLVEISAGVLHPLSKKDQQYNLSISEYIHIFLHLNRGKSYRRSIRPRPRVVISL